MGLQADMEAVAAVKQSAESLSYHQPASDAALHTTPAPKRIRLAETCPSEGGEVYRNDNDDVSTDPEALRHKKVSDMTPNERLQWTRIQSRDHSRKSRQRRKQVEQVANS